MRLDNKRSRQKRSIPVLHQIVAIKLVSYQKDTTKKKMKENFFFMEGVQKYFHIIPPRQHRRKAFYYCASLTNSTLYGHHDNAENAFLATVYSCLPSSSRIRCLGLLFSLAPSRVFYYIMAGGVTQNNDVFIVQCQVGVRTLRAFRM